MFRNMSTQFGIVAIGAAVMLAGCKHQNAQKASHDQMVQQHNQEMAAQKQREEAKRREEADMRRQEEMKRHDEVAMRHQEERSHEHHWEEKHNESAQDSFFAPDNKPHQVNKFIDQMAAAGAKEDATLNNDDFTGGKLNSVGQEKL